MTRGSRGHAGDEFGKAPSSGSAVSGVDGPIIGASSAIMLDALVEEESGKTPPPPPVSVKAVVVVLIVMFLLGLTILAILQWSHIPLLAPS
jgi:hypothetical protein